MSEQFISVKNFSKSFGKTRVIHNLSFDVNRGEIFAFIGGNGQGKTTTIRAILGLLTPDSGELLIQGEKYSSERSSLLGYLPEERGLYTSAGVFETMVYFGEIKGMSKNDAKARADEILETVGLSDKKDTKIKKLSSGQQQKIQLAITIINDPELLILDEPTKGLDPVNRDLFMQLFLDMNRKGTTIIFSTHQMDEAEKVADRVLMIKEGRKVLYGDLQEVKKEFGQTVQVNFSGSFPINEELYSARTENRFAELTLREGVEPSAVLQYLLDEGLKIERFEVTTPSLNEIFIRISREDQSSESVSPGE